MLLVRAVFAFLVDAGGLPRVLERVADLAEGLEVAIARAQELDELLAVDDDHADDVGRLHADERLRFENERLQSDHVALEHGVEGGAGLGRVEVGRGIAKVARRQ